MSPFLVVFLYMFVYLFILLAEGTFRPFNYTADDIFIVNVDQYHEFVPVLGVNASQLGQYRVMVSHCNSKHVEPCYFIASGLWHFSLINNEDNVYSY